MSGFVCPACGRAFDTLIGLRTHVLLTHRYDVCPVCGERFSSIRGHLFHAGKTDDEHAVWYSLLCSNPCGSARRVREKGEAILEQIGMGAGV